MDSDNTADFPGAEGIPSSELVHSPCPKCGTYQAMDFKQLKFSHCRTGKDWDFEKLKRNIFYHENTPAKHE